MDLQKHFTFLMVIISATAFAQDMNTTISTTKNQETIQIASANEYYNLGMAYFYGKERETDTKLGIHYLIEAAKKGHEKAMLNLTRAYLRGYKVRKHSRKAFYWAKKSAEKGNAEAQLYLGNMYLEGKGTQTDTKKGLLWILEAKQQGYVKADELWEKMHEYNT